MSDIPDKSPETLGDGNPPAPPSHDAKELIKKGVPIEDDVRTDLYELRNKDDSAAELGEYFKKLPSDKQKQLQRNGKVGNGITSIADVKGNEILNFPHKPEEKEEKSND